VRVIVVQPGAVATELPEHITPRPDQAARPAGLRPAVVAAEDIAEIIAFAVTRPQAVSLNEILVRPTAQALLPR
jgi:NADP-dependent 3-hydroxy acid dehydrogenase YdfG